MSTTTKETLEAGMANSEWINENIAFLKERYGGEYIAVDDGDVIAHDEDSEHVIEQVQAISNNPESVITTFIYESGHKILR